jgi:hypothetical protein
MGNRGAVPASANGGSAPTVQADWLISLLPPVGRCRRTVRLTTRLDDGEGRDLGELVLDVTIEAALPERDPEPVMGPDGIFELAATELLRLAAEMRLSPGQ